jgi:hypothetical protein
MDQEPSFDIKIGQIGAVSVLGGPIVTLDLVGLPAVAGLLLAAVVFLLTNILWGNFFGTAEKMIKVVALGGMTVQLVMRQWEKNGSPSWLPFLARGAGITALVAVVLIPASHLIVAVVLRPVTWVALTFLPLLGYWVWAFPADDVSAAGFFWTMLAWAVLPCTIVGTAIAAFVVTEDSIRSR